MRVGTTCVASCDVQKTPVLLARDSRQVFCAAEGRELVTYDAESDSSAGLPPSARYFVMGARSVRAGRTAMELEVKVDTQRQVLGTCFLSCVACVVRFVQFRFLKMSPRTFFCFCLFWFCCFAVFVFWLFLFGCLVPKLCFFFKTCFCLPQQTGNCRTKR